MINPLSAFRTGIHQRLRTLRTPDVTGCGAPRGPSNRRPASARCTWGSSPGSGRSHRAAPVSVDYSKSIHLF